MIGLQPPAQGDVLYDGRSFWGLDEEARRGQLRKFGVLFQSGALWSSMTLAENISDIQEKDRPNGEDWWEEAQFIELKSY